MLKFKLQFECDNDAFVDDMNGMIANTLVRLADKIYHTLSDITEEEFTLRDINGNYIGVAKLTEDSDILNKSGHRIG
jgi:hypothetical protein